MMTFWPTESARLCSYRCQLTFPLISGSGPELLASEGKVGRERALVKQKALYAGVKGAFP
jgi:hypothetical protein